ncbi:MAG TPA: MarC family protein [Anaeromyxobacteraceae bacterium]|nr:MarC family protein [Anaeromyxobacteraceae bacterium]
MLREVLTHSFVALSAIFVVVDPFAAVPFFLAMTSEQSPEERRETARRAAIGAWLILTAFGLLGALLFRLLGISIPAFKMAGGILLLLIAIDMIRTAPSPARITPPEVEAGQVKDDVAIVPLAMPLLAGPGSIATVIVLMGRVQPRQWWNGLPVLVAIAVVGFVTYVTLAGATRVERVLSRTGMNILERVAGMLLAAIALQFMIDGAGEAFPGLLR